MTTQMLPKTLPTPTYRGKQHWVRIGQVKMWCIQYQCDGTHHVYCDCHQ